MRSIAKKGNLFMIALVMMAVSLVAVACASASPNTAEGGSLPVNTGGGGTTEKASLAYGDFASYATFATASGSQQAGIWVSGVGVVTLEPDIAFLTLGVEAQASTVAQARAEAAAAMDAVFASLKANGVEDKDIRTTNFSIYPQYTYPRDAEPVLTGYRVNNQVSVKVRDLDSIGEVIDDVADAGGDNTRINGIRFSIDDDSEAQVQARELAVNAAIAKAEQFAELTDVTLGKLMYISESGGGVVYPERAYEGEMYLKADMSSVPTTSISGGEMEVRISIQAVFGIE